LICLFFTFLFPLCLTVVIRSVKKERAMKNHFTFAWELSITYDIAADQFPQSDIHLSVFEITFAEVSCVCERERERGKERKGEWIRLEFLNFSNHSIILL
jgi:hypothetical protein